MTEPGPPASESDFLGGWFGASWDAPVCEPERQRPTPVGASCFYCEEAFVDGERGFTQPQYGLDERAQVADPEGVLIRNGQQLVASHLECSLRQVFGSVGHIEGRCSCYGGQEEDPPGLSRRQAARAAVAAFERKHGTLVGGHG